MNQHNFSDLSFGTKALILSKLYYSVLSKRLEKLDVERYFSVLFFLHKNNGCNQQFICNNLNIDKTAMVKVIDYLIKVGFVDRNINPQDRREHFIMLTKKGQKQTLEIVNSFEEIDYHIFSAIPKDEQEIFYKVLEKLSFKLKELPSHDLFFSYKPSSRKTKNRVSDNV